MTFGWPQVIWIGLTLSGLGIEMSRHGQYKEGLHSVWPGIIGTAMTVALLYWGGFFG